MLEVRTKMGRRVRCTPDHPWLVGDGAGGEVEIKLAEDLTTDDWLPLAMERTRELAPAGRLVARWPPPRPPQIAPDKLIVRPRREHLDALAVRGPRPARDHAARGRCVYTRWPRPGCRCAVRRCARRRTGPRWRPSSALDDAFWRVVGLYLAEGHATPERLHWSFHPEARAASRGRGRGLLAAPRSARPRLPPGDGARGPRAVEAGFVVVDAGPRPGAHELRAAPPGPHLGPAAGGQVGAAVRPLRRRRIVVAHQRRPELHHRDGHGQR